MFIASRIEELLNNQKGLSKKAFCAKVGISVQGLDNILKGTEPGVSKIERIADFFHLPIDYFFDRNNPGNITSIGHQITGDGNRVTGDISLSEYQKEIEHLRQLLEEKEKAIADKERTIQILLNKN